MGMREWMNRRQPKPAVDAQPQPQSQTTNKRPKIDPEVAKERAREHSPWRFDDGPSRRPVGNK
jgi:hypothetical protein